MGAWEKNFFLYNADYYKITEWLRVVGGRNWFKIDKKQIIELQNMNPPTRLGDN